MHTIGRYESASRSLDGGLIISFSVDDEEELIKELEDLKGSDLVIDAEKYREKRSINANKYFWKLCTQIANKLGTTKDAIYLWELSRYGIYEDITVLKEAENHIRQLFRYVEDLTEDPDSEYKYLRCYIGSSIYNTYEMHTLLNGTVNDAHDVGISTWSQEEIDNLIANWKGEKA